ncbi:MAG: TetR/AcrR family transcriptional regulator [Lentisphaeria bacterium]|nr:TetR/AcrR family transcriptional regulator [Lentisphaeria bacterium]NQZ71147.1 TetR/AcrR family transcriptional regulator [Lentisphaeria bacterium]
MVDLMIRRKRISGDERKIQILRSALPLFAKKGLSGTTTRELAEATGVSEALIYKHFPSKEKLFDSIEAYCLSTSEANIGIVESLEANTESLVRCIYLPMYTVLKNDMVQNDMDDKDFHRLVVHSLLSDGEFAHHFLKNTYTIWREKVESCIVAAREAGDITIKHRSTSIFPWLVQHMVACYAYKHLPEKNLVDYGIENEDDLVDEFTLFALRGIGLHQSAIEQYYHPSTF